MHRLARGSILALALILAPAALAADPGAEIDLQRKLDTAIDLELDKVPLAQAFEELAGKGKIALQIDPASYEMLPYGNTTRVSATFRQSKLRDCIDEVLRPLALEKTISGPKVIISPTAPLARVGKRATWEELNILQKARTAELPAHDDIRWTSDLRPVLGVENLSVEIADLTHNNEGLEQVKRVLPATVWKALDTYAAATKQVWFVSGPTIQVMPPRQWIERQLSRPIAIEKLNRPLAEIVSELSHLSGVHFSPDAGLYAAFPSVTLNSSNGTLRQVLDTLKGTIGLTYELRDDGIAIGQAKTQPTTQGRTDSIVGQIAVPLGNGNSFLVFVRESDLPPEISELRKKKIREAIEAMGKTLGTAPATAPKIETTGG